MEFAIPSRFLRALLLLPSSHVADGEAVKDSDVEITEMMENLMAEKIKTIQIQEAEINMLDIILSDGGWQRTSDQYVK